VLKQRVITALVLAALVLLALFSESVLYWRILINALVLVGFWEWLRFCRLQNVPAQGVAYLVFAVVLWSLQTGFVSVVSVVPLVCLIWLVLFVFTVSDKLNFLHQTMIKIATGVVILTMAGTLVIELRGLDDGRYWILAFLVSVFAADIGAYFVGRRFGKTKLSPKVSPNKTVEGLVGGLVFALLLVTPIAFNFFESADAWKLLLIVGVTVLVSVLGDLFISKHKRHAGLKDSSQVLPGHGGVLDRVDSLLSAAPFFVYGLILIGFWS